MKSDDDGAWSSASECLERGGVKVEAGVDVMKYCGALGTHLLGSSVGGEPSTEEWWPVAVELIYDFSVPVTGGKAMGATPFLKGERIG
jgi:hypothetical protein